MVLQAPGSPASIFELRFGIRLPFAVLCCCAPGSLKNMRRMQPLPCVVGWRPASIFESLAAPSHMPCVRACALCGGISRRLFLGAGPAPSRVVGLAPPRAREPRSRATCRPQWLHNPALSGRAGPGVHRGVLVGTSSGSPGCYLKVAGRSPGGAPFWSAGHACVALRPGRRPFPGRRSQQGLNSRVRQALGAVNPWLAVGLPTWLKSANPFLGLVPQFLSHPP